MENQELTFGQKLIYPSYGLPKDSKLKRVYEFFAEMVDLVNSENKYNPEDSAQVITVRNILSQYAIGEILNAQMNIVKILTLK